MPVRTRPADHSPSASSSSRSRARTRCSSAWRSAGLCHSDLSVVDGNRRRPVPMLLGHEAAGIVEQVATTSGITVGQRVVMTFLPRCGDCTGCASGGIRPCLAGSASNESGTLLERDMRLSRTAMTRCFHHLGVSGFATHAVVDHRSVVPLDEDVPAEVASLLGCAVLTGGGAVVNAGPSAGGTAGRGRRPRRCRDGRRPDGARARRRRGDRRRWRTGQARPGHGPGRARGVTPVQVLDGDVRADVVIEAAGNARALETAVAMTDAGGTTVTVGLPAPDARASISPLASSPEDGRSSELPRLGDPAARRTALRGHVASRSPARGEARLVDLGPQRRELRLRPAGRGLAAAPADHVPLTEAAGRAWLVSG